ncbi:acyl-CoA dehydrogenase family protein [Nocardioides rubriscoriae]|uniref:acyl-CoA dehydrogenase family protein n=1 Tax=Nocardioides rubriscoriae TaxID=642762 RepID=UPI0011DFC34E|nr:acyl-CoA dehydrogenase family protein [Nocardioides rubriscoriae]
MEFGLSEEQQELVTTVRGLLAKRADPRAVRAAIASDAGHDEALWQTLVEQIGAAALAIPEAYDGAGFSLFESLLVLEEVGRSLAPSPLLSSLITAEALLAGADADARARLLPRIAAGEVAAFVDGSGAAVLDGDLATVLVAATDAGLVEVDPASARCMRLGSVDQTLRLAQVDLDGATTTPIGDADASRAARERATLVGTVGAAALATGVAARGLEMTVAYSKTRVQFGRPIGSFQALKHRMADMLVRVEMARSASWAASYAVSSRHDDQGELAHVAGSYCGEAAAHVAGETVQLHGGIAITWEHDAHLVFKRAHAVGQLFGQPHQHRALVEL